jgi:hypothetical protein
MYNFSIIHKLNSKSMVKGNYEQLHVKEMGREKPDIFKDLKTIITAAGLSGGILALIFNRMAKENNSQAVQQELNKALNEPQKIEQPAQTAEQQSETSEFAFDQPITFDYEGINNWSTVLTKLNIPHKYIKNNAGRDQISLLTNETYPVTIKYANGGSKSINLSEAVLKPPQSGDVIIIHPPQPEQKDVTQPESKQTPADQEAQAQLNPQETIDQTIVSSPEQVEFEVTQPPAEEQTQAEQITEEQSQAKPTLEQTA